MARILLTWELGGNYGHLTRLLPMARQLRAAGHEVTFAVRDTKVAGVLLTAESFEYVQAPLFIDRVALRRPPASYAELLLAEGYGSEPSLVGRVNAWLALYRLLRPNLIFADHSPTSLVAARAAGIPAIPTGNGFEIPPNMSPLPSIRPWEQISAGDLMRSEASVTRSINGCLQALASPRLLTHLGALFDTAGQLLATFPELDHYPARASATYDGPMFADSGTASVSWKSENLPRILAYVHNGLPGLKALIASLQSIEADVVCVVPELTQSAARKYSAKSLRVLSKPVQLSTTFARVDLLISQAGFGTVAQSLLTGVPLVLVPGTVEQYLVARRVHDLGAGELIGRERTRDTFTAVIHDVLRKTTYRDAARRFAEKYSGYDTQAIVRRAAGIAEGIVGTRLH